MDSDQGKLFIGGVSWETTEDKLKDHFGMYGEVTQAVIMRDKVTSRPRGFGFVVFADPDLLDRVLQDQHTIDGRAVEAKRALSREEKQVSSRSGNANIGRNTGSDGNVRTKKIFVGGLPSTLTEESFCHYFEQYGNVTDVVIMYDQSTQRPRGFGFISFDSEDAVDRVLHKTFHDMDGKLVEVKRALPKEANPGNGRRMSSGGYQNYGNMGSSNDSYDGRVDTNRYGPPPAAGGGFPGYGSSSYGVPSYGYGTTNNGSGGYPGYGVGGYGSAPPNVAAYGGPDRGYTSGPTGGYVSGPPGVPRSSWSNQGPTGYGMQGDAAGYGANAGYGGPAPWNAPGSGGGGGGPPAGPTGQSPSGGAGYTSSYGYGYGGGEGSYGNTGNYGTVGGRAGTVPNSISEQPGGGAGYMGGGYAEPNGNSGYPNAHWRSESDPSHGMPQGGGYAVAHTSGAAGVGYGPYGGYGSGN